MKNLKTFESWGGSNYPAGAENDPSAPWNQRDPEYVRGVDLKPSDLKFEIVVSDYSETAILKNKDDGKIYAVIFDSSDDDFKDYMQVDREYIGRDEDGDYEYEYDWDNAEVDDEAIVAYASDDAKYNGLGKKLDDYFDGRVTLIDSDVAAEVIDVYQSAADRLEKSNKHTTYWGKKDYKLYNDMVDYLQPFLETPND